MTVAVGYRIEQADLYDAPQALVDRVVALMQAQEFEAIPEDPPHPAESLQARLRVRSQFARRSDWLAFAGDEVVGRVASIENRTGSNEHIREVMLDVRKDHRRRGIGRALFAAAAASLPTDGTVKLVEGWTSTRVPDGAQFAKRLGAKLGLHMRVSQVDLRTIDRGLLEKWAALEPEGYRVVGVDGDIPDELLPAAIDAFNALNRMPREGLEMEDWKFTPETIRDWERQRRARGNIQWALFAIEEATGAGVAFTQVFIDPRHASVVHQGGTAVDPAHQGRDLGKLLKGRMALTVLERMPEARFIRTDNAGTNAPMLAINDRMGFKEAWWGDVWQLPLERARSYAGL